MARQQLAITAAEIHRHGAESGNWRCRKLPHRYVTRPFDLCTEGKHRGQFHRHSLHLWHFDAAECFHPLVPLFLLARGPLAAINANTTKTLLFETPVPFEHKSSSLYLSYSLFFFPLSLGLISLLPIPWALFPLSLAPLSWHWPVTRVGNFCGGLLLQEGHWYTESAGWRELFWELVNMRTSSPKVYLHPSGSVTTRSNTEVELKRVHRRSRRSFLRRLFMEGESRVRENMQHATTPCFAQALSTTHIWGL